MCKMNAFSVAILVWLASHFAFYFQYSKYRDAAMFVAALMTEILAFTQLKFALSSWKLLGFW